MDPGFETEYCYSLDRLDVVDLGHNYVLSGCPLLGQFYSVSELFYFSLKKAFALRQGLQATFVDREHTWNCGLISPFYLSWRKS